METVMKPFIFIYHIVSKILSFPTSFLKKSSNELQESIENKKMQKSIKDSTVVEDNNQSIDNRSNLEGIVTKQKETKPLISYRYIIKYRFTYCKSCGIIISES